MKVFIALLLVFILVFFILISTNPKIQDFDNWYSIAVEPKSKAELQRIVDIEIEKQLKTDSKLADVIVKGTYDLVLKDKYDKWKNEAVEKGLLDLKASQKYENHIFYSVFEFETTYSRKKAIGYLNKIDLQ